MANEKPYYVTDRRNGTEDAIILHAPNGRAMLCVGFWDAEWDDDQLQHDADQVNADAALIVETLNYHHKQLAGWKAKGRRDEPPLAQIRTTVECEKVLYFNRPLAITGTRRSCPSCPTAVNIQATTGRESADESCFRAGHTIGPERSRLSGTGAMKPRRVPSRWN